jgi:uncharacterized protein YycO
MAVLFLIAILSIMFMTASIDNMVMQTEINDFMSQATFEEEVNGVVYYYIIDETIDEDTITKNEYSNGTPANPTLGSPGDIFVMTQSRMDYIPLSMQFITFLFGGHAGIVGNDGMLIESMGGEESDAFVDTYPNDLFIEERTVIGLRVNATKEERKQALDNAYSLVSKLYNFFYIFGTKDKYYCTDLCSRVYGEEFGLNYNLDESGLYVSTQDLIKSKDTKITFLKYYDSKTDKTHIYYLKSGK